MEQTLSIIKPDGVRRNIIGEVIQRFEAGGLRVVAQRMLRMTQAQAAAFYAVHRERPFFNSLVNFMTSGPVVVMVLEGPDAIQANRRIMGATNPKDAEAGTIRADFAENIEANTVHGSDAPETAAQEIAFFFPQYELVATTREEA